MSYLSFASAIQFGSTPSLACAKPSGVVAGSTLIAFVGDRRGNATTVSPPDGSWVAVGAKMDFGQSVGAQVYIKTATGSEPSSYTFTWSANTDGLGGGSVIIVADNSTSHRLSAGPTFTGVVSSNWVALTETPSGAPDTGTHYAYFPTEGSRNAGSILNSVTSGWTSICVISNRGDPADSIGHSAALFYKAYAGNAASGQCDVNTNLGIHASGIQVGIADSLPPSGNPVVVVV